MQYKRAFRFHWSEHRTVVNSFVCFSERLVEGLWVQLDEILRMKRLLLNLITYVIICSIGHLDCSYAYIDS